MELSPVTFLVIYFLPAMVGILRGSIRIGGIIVINLFLGWTLLGWVVALAWAASSDKEVR
jgi:hypothetical protein